MFNLQWIILIVFYTGFIFGSKIHSELYGVYPDTNLALDVRSIRTFHKKVIATFVIRNSDI